MLAFAAAFELWDWILARRGCMPLLGQSRFDTKEFCRGFERS